jgi:hypothetical protein
MVSTILMIYQGFYRKFADKVEDGTECEESTGEGICVDGQCKVNGCSVYTSVLKTDC